jgi:hypothetical protein
MVDRVGRDLVRARAKLFEGQVLSNALTATAAK